MSYVPFDYQDIAITETLARLTRAVRRFRDPEDSERRAFALSACTGAGKTVIASKVLEALLLGSDTYNTLADSDITVLWVTDDEALNAQTRQRMIAASQLPTTRLKSITNERFPEVLERGCVHFLNIQKLHTKSTKYTVSSDARPYTLWDTIARTVEESTLLVVLDEAHKGMKGDGDRVTTVRRLIEGEGSRPPVPIVWGISATPERFIDVMGKHAKHSLDPAVVVDTAAVQASGLLKDTIILSSPEGDATYDTTLLRDAVRRLREHEDRWTEYCTDEGIDPVVPLMVVQVGNKPSAAELNRVVGSIREEWDDLTDNNIRHVFGDHSDVKASGLVIRHIAPESIQDNTAVRVVLAIEAITTGWDCPRAEVLVSLRGAKDRTHITQLIGRMVRTPLARRINTDDHLNTVTCLLPKFDAQTTDEVVKRLTALDFGDEAGSGPVGPGPRPRVLRDPVTLERNPSVDTDVFDALAAVPTEIRPSGPTLRPIAALYDAAVVLSGYGMVDDASTAANNALVAAQEGLFVSPVHKDALESAISRIETTTVRTVSANLGTGEVLTPETSTLTVDRYAVDSAFSDAVKIVGKEAANAFQVHRLNENGDDDLIRAKTEVAAVATLPTTKEVVESAAKELTDAWLDHHGKDFALRGDDGRAAYLKLARKAGKAVSTTVVVPDSLVENTKDAKGVEIAPRSRHLFSDAKGDFPFRSDSSWEEAVLDVELGRKGQSEVIGWYRNPSRADDTSLQIPYINAAGQETSAQPDFLFFQRDTSGTVQVSVVDPHGTHFNDGIQRLRGMVDFVSKHEDVFFRFLSVAESTRKGKKVLVALDLMDVTTQRAVAAATSDVMLFDDEKLARPYAPPAV